MSESKGLHECLFECFAYTDFRNPQDAERLWAIREGIGRVNQHRVEWRAVTARKDHECMRGCAIKRNETYFQYALSGVSWGGEWKFCAACMAMILYFKGVEHMPPVFDTRSVVSHAGATSRSARSFNPLR